jgi:hypothetical protein
MKKWLSMLAISLGVIVGALVFSVPDTAKAAAYKINSSTGKCSDGKTTYFFEENTLYKQVGSSEKEEVKTFQVKEDWGFDDPLSIGAVYNNTLFIVGTSQETGVNFIYYVCNVSNDTIKKQGTKIVLLQQIGRYFISNSGGHTDVSTDWLDLYRFTNMGIKKVKRLAKNNFRSYVLGKKFYYSSYPNSKMKKMTVYSCDANGKNVKKICARTTKSKKEDSYLYLVSVKQKYLTIWDSDVEYKYVYAKKKFSKVKSTSENTGTKTTTSEEESTTYKTTKYKSFSALKKAFLAKIPAVFNGMSYASRTIKTVYGKKKALWIYKNGTTYDATVTELYVKKGKKIIKTQSIDGVPSMISADLKYIYVDEGSAAKFIYKYSGGTYKEYKRFEINSSAAYEKKDKIVTKWKKTYHLSDVTYATKA